MTHILTYNELLSLAETGQSKIIRDSFHPFEVQVTHRAGSAMLHLMLAYTDNNRSPEEYFFDSSYTACQIMTDEEGIKDIEPNPDNWITHRK